MNIHVMEARSRYDDRNGRRSKRPITPFPSSSNLKYLQRKHGFGFKNILMMSVEALF